MDKAESKHGYKTCEYCGGVGGVVVLYFIVGGAAGDEYSSCSACAEVVCHLYPPPGTTIEYPEWPTPIELFARLVAIAMAGPGYHDEVLTQGKEWT